MSLTSRLTRRYRLSMRHFIPADQHGFCVATHGHDFKVDITVQLNKDAQSEALARMSLDSTAENVFASMRNQLINDIAPSGTVEALGVEVTKRLQASELGPIFCHLEIIETRKNSAQFFPTNSSERT